MFSCLLSYGSLLDLYEFYLTKTYICVLYILFLHQILDQAL